MVAQAARMVLSESDAKAKVAAWVEAIPTEETLDEFMEQGSIKLQALCPVIGVPPSDCREGLAKARLIVQSKRCVDALRTTSESLGDLELDDVPHDMKSVADASFFCSFHETVNLECCCHDRVLHCGRALRQIIQHGKVLRKGQGIGPSPYGVTHTQGPGPSQAQGPTWSLSIDILGNALRNKGFFRGLSRDEELR